MGYDRVYMYKYFRIIYIRWSASSPESEDGDDGRELKLRGSVDARLLKLRARSTLTSSVVGGESYPGEPAILPGLGSVLEGAWGEVSVDVGEGVMDSARRRMSSNS